MARFHRLYDAAESSLDQERILTLGIDQFLKVEQKDHWSKILHMEYGISRSELLVDNNHKRILWFLSAISASVIALFFVVQALQTQSMSSKLMAQQFLLESKISHPGLSKGSIETDQQSRIVAIHAFDEGDYPSAIINFDEISEKTPEDEFYLSVSYLFEGKLDNAKVLFQNVLEKSQQYRQECNWYLFLISSLQDENNNSKIIFDRMNDSDWNYNKADKLIKSILE